MKKFLKILFILCVLSAGLMAQAKDGPFPIYASVGQWFSEAKGLKVQINIWKFINQDKMVVRVIVRDTNDKLVASGFTIHEADETLLDAIVTALDGHKMQVVLKPDYKIDTKTQKKYLELRLDMLELDSNQQPDVPTNLTRVE